MPNVIQAKRRNAVFQVQVIHAVAQDENERTMWVATCDDLHLVTEHSSYDGLIERVWEIAPELAEYNQPGVDVATMRLRFEFEDSAQNHPIAL
jgi:DNA-binding transcriptional regulator of glucitol operon